MCSFHDKCSLIITSKSFVDDTFSILHPLKLCFSIAGSRPKSGSPTTVIVKSKITAFSEENQEIQDRFKQRFFLFFLYVYFPDLKESNRGAYA